MTEGGKLWLVIATSSFSMGVDCPDICNVVHFGPPTSSMQYVQGSGKGGRNGNPSVALHCCCVESLDRIQRSVLSHTAQIQQSIGVTLYSRTFYFTTMMNFLKINTFVMVFLKCVECIELCLQNVINNTFSYTNSGILFFIHATNFL